MALPRAGDLSEPGRQVSCHDNQRVLELAVGFGG